MRTKIDQQFPAATRCPCHQSNPLANFWSRFIFNDLRENSAYATSLDNLYAVAYPEGGTDELWMVSGPRVLRSTVHQWDRSLKEGFENTPQYWSVLLPSAVFYPPHNHRSMRTSDKLTGNSRCHQHSNHPGREHPRKPLTQARRHTSFKCFLTVHFSTVRQ